MFSGTLFANHSKQNESAAGFHLSFRCLMTTEDAMDPVKVAARFVAFACYLNAGPHGSCPAEEAGWFARRSWKAFLPYASAELGEFLTEKPHGDLPSRNLTSA
jgi:hypothetical protein